MTLGIQIAKPSRAAPCRGVEGGFNFIVVVADGTCGWRHVKRLDECFHRDRKEVTILSRCFARQCSYESQYDLCILIERLPVFRPSVAPIPES